MRNNKKIFSSFQGFTLVELIVVITILIILWTIGFVSYTNYIGWARDTNRLSQIAWIYDGIESYKIKQEAPLPTEKVEVKSGTTIIAYQWYVWQDVLDTISYNKWGKDPKDESYFTYYLTSDKEHFQLMWYLEDQSNISFLWIQNTYATDYTKRYPTVIGAKLWILTDTSNNPIQEIPAIKSVWYLDITTATGTYKANFTDNKSLSGTGIILANLENNIKFWGTVLASCQKILLRKYHFST